MDRQKLEAEIRKLSRRLAATPQSEPLEGELIELMRLAKGLGRDGTGRYPDIYNELHQALDDLHAQYFPAKCSVLLL